MHSAIASSFVEYVNVVETIPLISGFPIFRGQPKQGNLLPSIARRNPRDDSLVLERDMLEQLALLGATLLPPTRTVLDTLVVAQHYGMKTRLLDWSSNPIASLWFACSDKAPGDVFVYALDTSNLLLKDPYSKDPFSHKETKVFQPRLNNSRILAQHGWFTLHCFSPRSKKWVPLEKNMNMKRNLIEIRVPEASRAEMLKSIDRHGTAYRTLFPDLQGLCSDLNWRHHVA